MQGFWSQPPSIYDLGLLPHLCSDVEDGAYVWREGTQISGNASNPPADTLAPLYGDGDVGYVIWNDEPGASHCPRGCTSFILGHSKGEASKEMLTCKEA